MYFFNFLQPSNQFEISHNPHMTTSVQAQHSQEVEKALAGSERALIPPYGGHRLGHMQVYSGTQGPVSFCTGYRVNAGALFTQNNQGFRWSVLKSELCHYLTATAIVNISVFETYTRRQIVTVLNN